MKKRNVILGVNWGGHDTSAALMVDGELVAACEEERYIGERHTREFPVNAINDCLKIANVGLVEVDVGDYMIVKENE